MSDDDESISDLEGLIDVVSGSMTFKETLECAAFQFMTYKPNRIYVHISETEQSNKYYSTIYIDEESYENKQSDYNGKN